MLGDVLPAEAFGFLLVFARLGALFFLAPAFGERSIPQRVRLALGLTVSLLVYLGVRDQLPAAPGSPLALTGVLVKEMLVGLMIALAARLLMSALHVSGTIAAFQNGLAFSQQFDPTQGTQSAITASFMNIVGLTLIFVTDLHIMMLEAMIDSYEIFPVGAALPVSDFAELVLDFVAASFLLGVQISAPFIVFGIVFNVGLGLIARLMPQLPVFFVALPMSIFFGFAILLIALPAMMMWFLQVFEQRLSVFVQ